MRSSLLALTAWSGQKYKLVGRYIDLQKSFVPSPHWGMWYKTFLGNYGFIRRLAQISKPAVLAVDTVISLTPPPSFPPSLRHGFVRIRLGRTTLPLPSHSVTPSLPPPSLPLPCPSRGLFLLSSSPLSTHCSALSTLQPRRTSFLRQNRKVLRCSPF